MTPDTSIGERIDTALLLFAKQLRAIDYNRVKKLITPEKEALDRAEAHHTLANELKALLTDTLKSVKLPKSYRDKVGLDVALLWDSQDATDGYEQGLKDAQEALNQKIKEVQGNG